MNSKIYLTITILSILEFSLIEVVGIITVVENVFYRRSCKLNQTMHDA